ncbi:MAG: helix-turn-helix transcriptional regulator [Gammaproteobacteria bacterium]|nr:helix-turn-helix transcriptional regulator [Gammaproteobacteria bacterium]
MTGNATQLTDLIGLLYQSADRAESSEQLHRELTFSMGFVASSVHSWSPITGKEVVHQMALRDHEPGSEALKAIIADYNAKWVRLNPLPRIGFMKGLLREGAVIGRHEFISDEEWRDSDFFSEISHLTEEVHTYSVIVRNLPKKIIIFNFSTNERSGEARRHMRASLELVAPHLVRLFTIKERLHDLQVGLSAALASMDRLRFGIVTLTQQRTIVVANSVAKLQMSAGDGLLMRENDIIHVDAAINKQLQALIDDAIERAVQCATGPCPPTELRLEERGGSKVTVVAYPLCGDTVRVGLETPVCMLLIHDSDLELTMHKELFSLLYELTPNETEVALAIARGLSVDETAEKLGHSVSTSRTVLKRVYAKTNTRRQNELAYLVLSHKDMIPQ